MSQGFKELEDTYNWSKYWKNIELQMENRKTNDKNKGLIKLMKNLGDWQYLNKCDAKYL